MLAGHEHPAGASVSQGSSQRIILLFSISSLQLIAKDGTKINHRYDSVTQSDHLESHRHDDRPVLTPNTTGRGDVRVNTSREARIAAGHKMTPPPSMLIRLI